MFEALRGLIRAKGIEPSYPVLPMVDDQGETNVPGIYAVGEVAGTPLVRLGINAGHGLVVRIAPSLRSGPLPKKGDEDVLDFVIVGSGASGLAASVAAHDLGLSYVTLEASQFANTFVSMTKGKRLLAEPTDVELRSRLWFEECTKEELLTKWRLFVREESLNIHEHERVCAIDGRVGHFTVQSDVSSYRARRVLLCLGKAGNPRTLGVPGEKANAAKISHRLLDPDEFRDQDIVIVGAGDVACEAAIALSGHGENRVVLSAIDKELTYPKERNITALRALEREGKVRIVLESRVTRIDEATLTIENNNGKKRPEQVPYTTIFEMIGSELPLKFFKKIGIRLNSEWPKTRWLALAALFLLVHGLYALKSYGKGAIAWPYQHLISAPHYDSVLGFVFRLAFCPFSWIFSEETLADMAGDRGFQQGYLYSGLYTVLMLVFGYQALIRWRKKAKDKRYQSARYVTLVSFQLAFFLLVNVVGVQALTVKYAWRAWGLYQPFPLFFNTFFWWYPGDSVALGFFFVGAGIVGTLVAIPLLARNHGKRFCTWVCGCGGLAETLGDRWRHLAAKGPRSRAWEFQGAVLLVAAFIIALVVVGAYKTDGNNIWWRAYSYLVDFWLVAVIPIALYPFFGGKVWCRYWCPLAAYNQLLARWYGRLKIVANDKCITCTECSKYCQVGVDVMAFAKNGQPFDNSNSACIQCGICIDICPMDVLSFETSAQRAADLIAEGKNI